MIPNNEGKGTILIHITIGFALTCFVFVILLMNFIIAEEKRIDDRIYPKVSIDHIPMGYKTKDEARKIIQKKYEDLPHTVITVFYKDAPVATLDAELLDLKTDIDEVIDKAYLAGRSEHTSSRVWQKFLLLFRTGEYSFETHISYTQKPLEEIISSLQEQYNIPEQNALFAFEENRVTSFQKESPGLRINAEKLYADIDTAIQLLKKKPGSKQIYLTDSVIMPEITLSNINDLHIEEQIGYGSSDFSHSIPERIHNIAVATQKFHGVLIPKDGVFSFNDIIGDISVHTGYKPSYIIKEGRTVLGDGGGVCQVSTTLFRAALNAGLPIVERHAHAYRVSYYENDSDPGFDATIFSPTVDLKFRNNTPGAILIQADFQQESRTLTFTFYGKKDGREVQLSDVAITNYQPPLSPVYQDDPTLPKGVTRQVDYAASGARAKFTYTVKRGDEILENTSFISNYRPWAAVYLVGTAE